MSLDSDGKSLRWLWLSLVGALILVSSGLVRHTTAQDVARGKIYVVTHVDIIPPQTAAGTKLVQQYVADTRKEKGLVQIEAFAQISRLNHISVVEVWESQQALDAHEAAEHTRKFRQQIDPMLGSPYDERLHQLLE